MTAFSQKVIGTLCNVMQWVIDHDPAPAVEQKLEELRDTLDASTNALADTVAANQPKDS